MSFPIILRDYKYFGRKYSSVLTNRNIIWFDEVINNEKSMGGITGHKRIISRKPKRRQTELKLIVHPDYFSGKMPAQLKIRWKRAISAMERNPKKFLLIVPYASTATELKASLNGTPHTELSGLINYAIGQLGRRRVMVMDFHVLGRIRDYPMNIRGHRDFSAGPRQRLQKILESRGVKADEIDRISASGIYLGECVDGNAESAAILLGVNNV